MRSAFPRNLLTSGWKVWNCEYRKKRRRLKKPMAFFYTHFSERSNVYGCNNNLIGIVFLEYNDLFKYPEDIIDLHDIKERASGISQLLEFKSMV